MAQSILAPGWLWLWNWAVLLHPYSIFSWGMCSFTSYPTILFAARWIKDELISKGIFHLANICYCSQLWKLRISLMNFKLHLTQITLPMTFISQLKWVWLQTSLHEIPFILEHLWALSVGNGVVADSLLEIPEFIVEHLWALSIGSGAWAIRRPGGASQCCL
jgi:hypothetical protein